MSRSRFACLWLVIPICFAQTAALRPDATPVEDPQMRAEAVGLMERAIMLTSPVWPANEEFVIFRALRPAAGEARIKNRRKNPSEQAMGVHLR